MVRAVDLLRPEHEIGERQFEERLHVVGGPAGRTAFGPEVGAAIGAGVLRAEILGFVEHRFGRRS
ncbi:MAG: hypothetical protein AMXMBFR42_27730 [Burkholderiales bacterium]